MSGFSVCQLWLPPKPQFCRFTSSYHLPGKVSYARLKLEQRRSMPRPEPSASQLLRFAVTGTIKAPNSQYSSETLEKHVAAAFAQPQLPETWTIFNSSSVPNNVFNKSTPPVDRFDPVYFQNAAELPKIHAICERYLTFPSVIRELQQNTKALVGALKHCGQYEPPEKILITLNAIFARFDLLKIQIPQHLLIFGMKLAAQHFSAAALRSYIQSYVAGRYDSLPARSARDVIRNLYLCFKSSVWASPAVDLGPMREVVTGLDEKGMPTSYPSLLSLLLKSDGSSPHYVYSQYVQLLGVMGDSRGLFDFWPTVQARLQSDPSNSLVQSLISHFLMAILRAGFGKRAVEFAKQLSTIADLNDILSPSLWKKLLQQDDSGALQNVISSEKMTMLLHEELSSIERRLGITWHPDGGGHHVRAADLDLWADHWLMGAEQSSRDPNLNLSGLSKGSERLFEEILLHGSSKSLTELSIIANLLHDFEGSEIPIGSKQDEEGNVHEFVWCPQCSPIKFSGCASFNETHAQSPSSLGLIRALHYQYGEPTMLNARNLYLMQLGYLCERIRGPVEGSAHSDTGETERWVNTGHIIFWERSERRFMMIYLEKGFGTIDPGLYPRDSHPYLPSVAMMNLNRDCDYGTEVSKNLITPLEGRYWMEVDPAVYFQP
ncbi:hypothetical protein GX48_00803 [Paracoccidioides brasiliensis]|nr:hypothetical protein GX48_00803 [Paracoccidioides brasiliensis]